MLYLNFSYRVLILRCLSLLKKKLKRKEKIFLELFTWSY